MRVLGVHKTWSGFTRLILASRAHLRSLSSGAGDANDDEDDVIGNIIDSHFGKSPKPSPPPTKTESSNLPVSQSRDPPDFASVIPLAFSGVPLLPSGFSSTMALDDPDLRKALILLAQQNQPYVGLFMSQQNAAEKKVVATQVNEEPKPDEEVEPETSEMSRERDGSSRLGLLITGQRVLEQGPKVQSLEDIHPTGTLCRFGILPERSTIVLLPIRRITISGLNRVEQVPIVKVRHHRDPVSSVKTIGEKKIDLEASVETVHDRIIELARAYMSELDPSNPSTFSFSMNLSAFLRQVYSVSKPGLVADFALNISRLSSAEAQEALETFQPFTRLGKARFFLQRDLQRFSLKQQLSQDVREQINERQERALKMEQLKLLRKELGLEKDDKEELIKTYNERLAKKTVPGECKKVIDEEMDKLRSLENSSMEFNVTRNYLDWLTVLPWGVLTSDNLDVNRAEEILDEDHYGLQDIKDRILEFIAVARLLGSPPTGRILCFSGPPGVGKTSIGKSIARALNRKFYRFSVGGMSDVAEIKGHRRTYVGAMPGKLIQCLKSVETSNPVVLIDEIDKLGRDFRGDPASALLEVLDPEQNSYALFFLFYSCVLVPSEIITLTFL